MPKLDVISSDSHVVEPPQLWTERMDAKRWGQRIPRLVKGNPYDRWLCDGENVGTLGGASSAGMRFTRPQDITLEGNFARVPPGGYDPRAHIKDLELDGVSADVLYSSVCGNMYAVEDSRFLRAVFDAYNEWLAGFCRGYPGRLNGVAQILVDDDMDAGIKQLQRAAKLGLKGAMIPVYPRPAETYDHPMYDPLWAAAQDLNMPLSLHVGTKRPGTIQMRGADGKIIQGAPERCTSDHWVRLSLGALVFSGVFERYPNLKVVNVEHELSWLPYFMMRMDSTYIERPTQATYRYKGDMLPRDFMHRNVFHGFQEDAVGIQLREIIGVSQIMWGNDYPHAESTFPKSREILDRVLAGVPENEKTLIASGNCRRLYGLK
ncbi:MAG: amidohydrolase [SAR202 cluster bacterium]|nr:amidohydrolase [SAR202 cluster bacterium]